MNNDRSERTVPVLLTVFNRPEKTNRVINALRNVKPYDVFVVADGPRIDHPDDADKCHQTRELIKNIDWDCDLKTLFRDKNMGCDLSVSSAIDWFFSHVPYGVILEDDCISHPDFFPFCADMFERFADDQRIMQVSGLSPYPDRHHPFDYHFSRTFRCWGWGTWRRAWSLYSESVDVYDGCVGAILKAYYPHSVDFKIRYLRYQAFKDRKRDNWDFKWNLACYANNGLAVVPEKNLVINIGFDDDSTHTSNSSHWLAGLQSESLSFPLRHPLFVYADTGREATLRPTIHNNLNVKGRLVSRYRHLVGACKDFWGSLV